MTTPIPLRVLTSTIHGKPVTQGSMKAIVHRHSGKAIVVQDHKSELDAWRGRIANTIRSRRDGRSFTGPVSCELVFRLRRPAAHSGTKGLFPSSPVHPIVKPDIDKLARAVLDALTQSGVWRDDSQAVEVTARKVYADGGTEPGVTITLRALPSRMEAV